MGAGLFRRACDPSPTRAPGVFWDPRKSIGSFDRMPSSRVSYVYSETTNLFVVNPLQNVFGSNGLLGLFSTGKATYHEVEATLRFRPVKLGEFECFVYLEPRAPRLEYDVRCLRDLSTAGDPAERFRHPAFRCSEPNGPLGRRAPSLAAHAQSRRGRAYRVCLLGSGRVAELCWNAEWAALSHIFLV
jgi:hypothetical protein